MPTQVAKKAKAIQTVIENGSKPKAVQAKIEQLKSLTEKQIQGAIKTTNAQVKDALAQTGMSAAKETTENVYQDDLNNITSNSLEALQNRGEFKNIDNTNIFKRWVVGAGGDDRAFYDYEGNIWKFTGGDTRFDPKNIELVERKKKE